MKISKGTQTAGTVFKFKGKRPFAHNRIQMHGICENSVQGVCVRGGCWGILCFPAFASESQLSQSRKVEENKERNTTCLAVRTMSIHIATAFFPRRSVVLLSCLFSPNVWDTGKKKKSTAINTLTGRLWWSRLWVVQSHRKRSEGLPASGTMLPKASRDELPTRYLIFRSDIETPKLKKKSKFLKTKISKFF